MPAVTISTELIEHVRLLLEFALEATTEPGIVRVTDANRYTPHALPAYILAVAAVEAFVSEFFHVFKGDTESALSAIPSEARERLDLQSKLVVFPQLVYGRTFSAAAPPLQDFSTLLKVRNDLTHYKMGSRHPKYMDALKAKKVPLRDYESGEDGSFWVRELSTSNGILWAHNTAVAVVEQLVRLRPSVGHVGDFHSGSFWTIPDGSVADYLGLRNEASRTMSDWHVRRVRFGTAQD